MGSSLAGYIYRYVNSPGHFLVAYMILKILNSILCCTLRCTVPTADMYHALTCGWSERLTDGETKNIDTQMQGVGDLKKKILSNTDNDAVTAAADLDNLK